LRRYAGFGLVLTVLALFIQLAAPLTAARAAEANPFSPFPICSSQGGNSNSQQPADHNHGCTDCCTLCHLVQAFHHSAAGTSVAFIYRPPQHYAFVRVQSARKTPSRYLLSAHPRAPPLFS
jgi:hypothetical protein